MNTSLDDWFALPDKINMIPNDETAHGLRDMYVCIEVARLEGGDCSNNQRYLKNTVDFILSKYKDNANNGDNQMTRKDTEAPTKEQIKKLVHGDDKEEATKHYPKKYSDYEEGIDTLNMVLNNWIKPDNCLGDVGQKCVIDVMGKCGWEVDPILPEISNQYVNLLEEALSKCPFSKAQAKEFAVEHITNSKHAVERRSLWDWIWG